MTSAPTKASETANPAAATVKVALVTGCSEPGSLGAAIALDLARRGWRVFATARKPEMMADLGTKGCDLLALDVTSHESIAAAAQAVTDKAGRLDLLVNNAGVTTEAPLLDTDLAALRALFEVNVFGTIAVSQAFAPLLVTTASPTAPTVIINIGSVVKTPLPFMSAYGASKAAVQAFSDAQRLEMHNLHVRVVTVELGGVATAMAAGSKKLDSRKTDAAERSGLYENWPQIQEAFDKAISANASRATPPGTVARQLVDAATRTSPPAKLWVGMNAAMSRWIIPLLPTRLVDYVLFAIGSAGLVQAPEKKD